MVTMLPGVGEPVCPLKILWWPKYYRRATCGALASVASQRRAPRDEHPGIAAWQLPSYLITIGAAGCNPDYAASCNEFIGLSNLLLDASHAAAGAVRIISAMGVTVGPAVFVERFAQTGIRIDGGHETLIHEAWFVETYWNNLPPAAPPPPAAGAPIMQKCDGSAAQQWKLVAARDVQHNGGDLPGSLVSAATGQCLDVDGCDTPTVGTGSLMWSCNTAFPGNNCNSTNQLWTLAADGQLVTAMDSAHGHMCMEAPSLRLAQCDTSNPDQKWTLHPNGTLTSPGQGSGRCVTSPGHHGSALSSTSPAAPPPQTLNNRSIAVQINGNDHYMVDSIIWQYTYLGVEINGAANLLQGVHAWGSGCGRFTYLTGIKVNGYQNRLLGCYLDLNHLDLTGSSGPQSIVVVDSFFLGTNTRIYGEGQGGKGVVSSLYMQFNLGNSVQLIGNFSQATNCLITGQGGPKTQAAKQLTLQGLAAAPHATSLTFDFSQELLFPWIDSVQYTVLYDSAVSSPLTHYALKPVGRTVTVMFAPATATGGNSNTSASTAMPTVHMEVAQCL